jgi:hypothetical protein
MIGRWLHGGCNAVLALIGATALGWADTAPDGTPPVGHDYPTYARVEYVQECMFRNGGEIANLYKCSCAIDRIAKALSYDDFVEWGTFARNASLAGEKGGIFRDFEQARDEAKRYRTLETDAYRACGLRTRQ